MEDLKSEKNKTSIYITSWSAYNEGSGRGGWLALEDLTTDNYLEAIKKLGLDPDGYDEELVIHDYDDYEFSGVLSKLFGEAYPLEVVAFYEKWQKLDDDEKNNFLLAYMKRNQAKEAMNALEDETLGIIA